MAECGREQVQKADLDRLKPRSWLNDEVINFYGAMVTARADRWAALCTSEEPDSEVEKKREEEMWFGYESLGGTGPPVAKKSTSSGVNGHGHGHRKGKGKGKHREREYGEPLSVHYFSTFFYSKLTTAGYEKARLNKWTKKVRLSFPMFFFKDSLKDRLID